MTYSLKEICSISSCSFAGKNDQSVSSFLTDSRDLSSPTGTLFVAIKSVKNNGHNYIHSLIEKGVKAFIIGENELDILPYINKDVSFAVCKDPLVALQKLAAHHRRKFKIPVIGITGSNGKTVVKEWLYQLLKKNHTICRSPKSFNSQIGVPLSILRLDPSHTLGIFEAGISLPGEMQKLQEIIQPNIGILTSFGSAHDEGFSSPGEKLFEKCSLFKATEWNVLNGVLKSQISESLLERSTVINEGKDSDIQFSLKGLELNWKGIKEVSLKIPFNDNASAQNISTCMEVLFHLGMNEDEIISGIKDLQSIALRLEIKAGVNNSLLINDYYNSDLDSLRIALNFLQQQNRRKKKALIISDIEQSGILESQLYKTISELVASSKIDLVCGIGKKISAYRSLFRSDSIFMENTAEFLRSFHHHSYRFSDCTVLLKGARSFGFEDISQLMQQKSHDTVLEIDLTKLTNNISYFKKVVGPDVKLMCMVKAMGYGGGGSELARMLQHVGVNYLAVAYADEGVELRQSNITLPIMVMNPESDANDDIILHELEPEIYNFRTLREFIAALERQGISSPYPIHLKLDTGMHRLGFEEKDMNELISVLKKNPQIKIVSVFSHLAASNEPSLDDFSNKQISSFIKMCEQIQKGVGQSFIKHICNSGAVCRFPNAHFDMVRLGIGMHGIGVDEKEQKELQSVASLRTKISQIKHIRKGESVGYSRSGMADKDMKIATIPIGYADGFSRSLGKGNFGVHINGAFCRTFGNVCMDMCMIDVSEVNCEEGDEVIVFENITQLKEMAAAVNSITYEVLTGVSGRVKRVYVW